MWMCVHLFIKPRQIKAYNLSLLDTTSQTVPESPFVMFASFVSVKEDFAVAKRRPFQRLSWREAYKRCFDPSPQPLSLSFFLSFLFPSFVIAAPSSEWASKQSTCVSVAVLDDGSLERAIHEEGERARKRADWKGKQRKRERDDERGKLHEYIFSFFFALSLSRSLSFFLFLSFFIVNFNWHKLHQSALWFSHDYFQWVCMHAHLHVYLANMMFYKLIYTERMGAGINQLINWRRRQWMRKLCRG